MDETTAGHRTVPHPADVTVEAWAPTREQCLAEAVIGAVRTFVDTTDARPTTERSFPVTADTDADLLVAALEEMIYLLDTAGLVPVDVRVSPCGDGMHVHFTLVEAATVPQIGAVPKAVSWHELRFDTTAHGWSCAVNLDV